MLDRLPCPVCDDSFPPGGWAAMADHLVAAAERSDARHVMWLNRRVTKHRTPAGALAPMLQAVLEGRGDAGAGGARVAR